MTVECGALFDNLGFQKRCVWKKKNLLHSIANSARLVQLHRVILYPAVDSDSIE